jgi:hypothetical protein
MSDQSLSGSNDESVEETESDFVPSPRPIARPRPPSRRRSQIQSSQPRSQSAPPSSQPQQFASSQQDLSSQHVDRSIERPTTTKKRPWSEFVELFGRRTKFINETAYQFPRLPDHDEDVFQPQHGWMELPYGIYGHQFDAGQAQRRVTGGILWDIRRNQKYVLFLPCFQLLIL